MVTFILSQNVCEFTKSRAICAIRASVVYMPTWPRHNMPNACQLLTFTCQHANKCANVPKVCQLFNLASQRAKTLLIFYTWGANVPNGMPIFHFGMLTPQKACQIFKHSSYEMLREISILYYYIKNSTLYLISQLYI